MGWFDSITESFTGDGLLGAAAGLFGSSSANEASAKAAERANAFTTRQMKNRHQWEVQDLRKAGLNPVLSAMNGAPSMGGAAQAQVFNPADAAAKGVQSALASKRLNAEIKNINQDTETKMAQEGVALSQRDVNNMLASVYQTQRDQNLPSAALARYKSGLYGTHPKLMALDTLLPYGAGAAKTVKSIFDTIPKKGNPRITSKTGRRNKYGDFEEYYNYGD